MYYQRPASASTSRLTFVSLAPVLYAFFHLQPVSCRDVYNNLLSSRFKQKFLLDDDARRPDEQQPPALYAYWDELDEWAGVEGSWEALLRPTRRQTHVSPTSTSPSRLDAPASLPTQARLLSGNIRKRDTFSTNVCPISTQTTVFVSLEGTSAVTLSTQVGPRPTGIPGDAGTSDGVTDEGDGSTNQSGRGLNDKEGLITGIVVVVAVLLASICALLAYCYRKRRRTNQRRSISVTTDTGDYMRQMGSKGIQSFRNPPDASPVRPTFASRWSPFNIFGRSTEEERRKESLDSNELRERKSRFTVAENSPENPFANGNSVPTGDRHQNYRISSQYIPHVISSPVISAQDSIKRPGDDPTNPSPRSSLNPDYVPLVSKRVSQPNQASTSRAAPHHQYNEQARISTGSNLRYEAYPPRNSQGEPVSPSVWMPGLALASNGNVDPFLNPPTTSSPSDAHGTFQTHSRMNSRSGEGPNSPPFSLSSGEATRVAVEAPEPPLPVRPNVYLNTNYSMADHDAASEILGTLGSAFGDHDRPESSDSHSTYVDDNRIRSLTRRFTALSDVEEVLTPIADERTAPRPRFGSPKDKSGGPGEIILNSAKSSFSHESHGRPGESVGQGIFFDEHGAPAHWYRGKRRPSQTSAHGRLPSDTNSANGGKSDSRSGSISAAGTSVVDPANLDTGDWDDLSLRKREAENLFFSGLRGSPRSQSSGGRDYPRAPSSLSQVISP